jgi:hypothetical protein
MQAMRVARRTAPASSWRNSVPPQLAQRALTSRMLTIMPLLSAAS